MNWISTDEKMPDCRCQHGKSFASGYLLTRNKQGEYEINQYWKHGQHTSSGWVKNSEGWEEESEVTHWCEIIPPIQSLVSQTT